MRHIGISSEYVLDSFNPRICKRCDVEEQKYKLSLNSFNPRICKRCDYAYDVSDPNENVSIHASVKDATFSPFFTLEGIAVSIHASVKDATVLSNGQVFSNPFQSTHL